MAVLVLVAVVSVLNVAMACVPCSTGNFPAALKPCIGTPVEPVACVIFELVSSVESDVIRVVALVLVVLKVLLEILLGLGCNVKELLSVLTKCYSVAKADSALAKLLNELLNAVKKLLSGLLNIIGGLLGLLG